MPAPSLLNTVVGACYRLTRPLGEGGMGTVYEAQHLRLGGTVAVKILAPQYAADPKFRDRFKREARAASQIHHPNVVQITDFGETPNGSVFFTMEMLEGHDLHHILQKHAPAPFPIARALHLLAQAADALSAAHRVGIIHRDVKPSNIFVLESAGVNDFIKLLDFGIAKIVAPTPSADSALVKNLTGTGEIFGTAKYMAPEQAYGGSNDPRMDVYSLGVVAYELLTGRVPYTGQSNFEIITRHVYDSPRPLRELRPDLPAALEAVVLRAMEKKAENRFATMEEFGKALRQVDASGVHAGAVGSSVPSARTHTDTNATTMPRGRRRDLLPVEPAAVPNPMQSSAGQPAAPAAVRAPAALGIRKTIPAIAAAPSPPPAVGPPMQAPAAAPPVAPFGAPPVAPFGAPPVAPFGAPSPAAPPPVAYPSAPPPAASPTDSVVRMQPPTGPLARRGGSAYDDTARDRAMRSPGSSSAGRTAALVLISVVAIASLSATAAILVLRSNEEPPAITEARLPTSDPPSVPLEPPPSNTAPGPAPTPATGPQAMVPTVEAPTPTGTNEPGVGSSENAEVVAPGPTPDVAAPEPIEEPSRRDPKPSSIKPPKPRPSPTAPAAEPQSKTAKQIGSDIQRKIKRECETLGNGKEVIIDLEVGSNGRISNKVIGAIGPLRACIIEAIGDPQFPRATKLSLSPVIGKCVEAFGSTVSKCK